MSNNYQARRALNVSAYLQNLNAISPTQEPLDEYNPADDLTIWTDTTFFDFDMGAQIAQEPSHDLKKPTAVEPVDPVTSDNGFNDFMHGSCSCPCAQRNLPLTHPCRFQGV